MRFRLYIPRHPVEFAYCLQVSPLKLLRKPRYGAFHLFAKTPRDDPTEYPPHRHCCLGMESVEKRISQTNNNLPAADVCASSTRYTFWRSAPPSTSLYRKQKPELQNSAMAYTIATEQRILQVGGLQTGSMAYAITTGRRIPQFGGQSSRRNDPSGRPRHFVHGSTPCHSFPPPRVNVDLV